MARGVAAAPGWVVGVVRATTAALRYRRVHRPGRAPLAAVVAGGAELLLGAGGHTAGSDHARPARALPELSVLAVLPDPRGDRGRSALPYGRPAALSTPRCGAAHLTAHPRIRDRCGVGRPGNRRRLPVSAPAAPEWKPAHPDGSLALVHSDGCDARTDRAPHPRPPFLARSPKGLG